MAEKKQDAQDIVEGGCDDKREDDRWQEAENGNEKRKRQDIGQGADQADEEVEQKLHGQWRIMGSIVQDAVQRTHTIFPANFFPFFVSSGGIANGAFIDAAMPSGYMRGYFWLKSKSIFFQFLGNRKYDIASEKFVTCLHI